MNRENTRMDLINQLIESLPDAIAERTKAIEAIRELLNKACPQNSQPIDRVRWVPIEKVQANNYNPNAVARNEMRLLYTSILHDGYTQPVVTIYDETIDKYVIVDGFHRYSTMKMNRDIYERNNGLLPIVVINKDINDRMASTVRHNRARGKHSVNGMSSMVFSMLENGWGDADICNELGMEPDELLRLKVTTGFLKLFENREYSDSWKTKNQILIEKKYKEAQNGTQD